MQMLATLDTVIGLAVVMLVVSAAVTVATGVIISTLNLRGAALRHGIAELLALLDQGFLEKDAHLLANHLLRTPVVGKPKLISKALKSIGSKLAEVPGLSRLIAKLPSVKPFGLATVIHREELTKLILDFACDGAATKTTEPLPARLKALQAKLAKSLKDNGIASPQDTLDALWSKMLELEANAPELSTATRATEALLTVASSKFLAKINAWFDQTVDRVTDNFTRHVHIVTGIGALFVAMFLQLDTLTLLDRLGSDPATRQALVTQAIQAHPPVVTQTKDVPANSPLDAAKKGAAQIRADPQLHELLQLDFLNPPATWSDWTQGWFEQSRTGTTDFNWSHLLGILITVALLSLGGPFWYNALQNLLGLRSILASRDDADRARRQSTQEKCPPAP